MITNNLLWSLAILAAGVYFAAVVWMALRSGEIARLHGSMLSSVMMDSAAEAMPDFRALKYISRADSPKRFWTAIVLRCCLVIIALLVSLSFFLTWLHS